MGKLFKAIGLSALLLSHAYSDSASKRPKLGPVFADAAYLLVTDASFVGGIFLGTATLLLGYSTALGPVYGIGLHYLGPARLDFSFEGLFAMKNRDDYLMGNFVLGYRVHEVWKPNIKLVQKLSDVNGFSNQIGLGLTRFFHPW
jgi:hypothetical protein